jgi:hypothetical protein
MNSVEQREIVDIANSFRHFCQKSGNRPPECGIDQAISCGRGLGAAVDHPTHESSVFTEVGQDDPREVDQHEAVDEPL